MTKKLVKANNNTTINIDNNTQKKQVSFAELKKQLKQASIEKVMGSFNEKHAKSLVKMEDAFFKSFLDGTSGVKRISAKMRKVLYDCYYRMNKHNYQLALKGKMKFIDSAKKAVIMIQKINSGLTRTSLVHILVYFYRFTEVMNTSDTYDELYIYSNDVHIYQPASNTLDKLLHKLYSNFDHGLLRLHSIIRLLEVNKYTKHIDIDNIKHYPDWVVCNNYIYDRRRNRLLKFSPNYFITNKLNANYPSKMTLNKIKHTTVKQVLDFGGTDKEIGANPMLLKKTIPEFMHYFFTMITSGSHAMERQLFQEILDALEPNYSHEAIVLNYGDSHTGKSEFTLLIRNIIGDSKYASMSVNQLQQKSALSTVVGKYAVLGDDMSGQIKIKDDSNVLKMARGANIYTEAKFKQGHTSTLKQAIINNINKFPKTASKGPWVNNRILVVSFKHQFIKKDDEDSKNYKKNPYYFNDDWVDTLFKSPQVTSYILYLTLHQPRFSRYIMTADSKRMIRVFANQNNPVQLFCNKIMQAPKNRLVKKVVYQQFIQFSREYGFSPKYKKMSFSDFNDSFKTCMPECISAQERLSKVQVLNQNLITEQFQLRVGRENSDKEMVQRYIQSLQTGHRYTCYVFPSIPSNIVDCDVDGIIFSILPNDEVKFPKASWFEVGEHDADANVLKHHKLLQKDVDGTALAKIMMCINSEGYVEYCKDYGIDAKKARIDMLKVAAYVRAAHKSYVTDYNERSNSTWSDLQYRINEGFKHDKEAKKSVKAKQFEQTKIKAEIAEKKIKQQLKVNQQKKSKSIVKVHVKLEPKTYTSANGSYVIDANKIDWLVIDNVKKIKPKTYIISMEHTSNGCIAHTNDGIKLKLKANNQKQLDKVMKSFSNGDVSND